MANSRPPWTVYDDYPLVALVPTWPLPLYWPDFTFAFVKVTVMGKLKWELFLCLFEYLKKASAVFCIGVLFTEPRYVKPLDLHIY